MKSLFFEENYPHRTIQNLLIYKLLQLIDANYAPEKIPNYFADDAGVVDLMRLLPSRRSGAFSPKEARSEEIKSIPYPAKVFFIETKPILGKVYYEENLLGTVQVLQNLALRIAHEHIDIYAYLRQPEGVPREA